MNIYIAAFLASIISTHSFAASFDCTKAKSTTEKAICSNPDLSKLDDNMSEAYKVAAKDYPVEGYVKAKQREWIKTNYYCEKNKLIECLRDNYKKRIDQLSNIGNLNIYSNTNNFSYENGDTVVEIRQIASSYTINLWGGARIHRQLTNENKGKPVFTECSFEGTFNSFGSSKAIDKNGNTLIFKIDDKNIYFEDLTQNCEGFANLPERLMRVRK